MTIKLLYINKLIKYSSNFFFLCIYIKDGKRNKSIKRK